MAPSGRWLWCASHPPTRPPRCAHRNCARRRRLTRDASRAPPRRLVAVICIGVNPAASLLRRRYVQAPRHPTRLRRASLCTIRASRCLAAVGPIARGGSWGSSEDGTARHAARRRLRCSAHLCSPPPSLLSCVSMQLVTYSGTILDDMVRGLCGYAIRIRTNILVHTCGQVWHTTRVFS